MKHEVHVLTLIVLQCFVDPFLYHLKLFITKDKAQFLHFTALFWAKITWYSLYRWLQKFKDRKNRHQGFKIKVEGESHKTLFSESICGEKDRKEMLILFTSFLSFRRQNSCVSYCFFQLDSSMLHWLVCYYSLSTILGLPGSEEVGYLQYLPHPALFKPYNFINLFLKKK